MSTATAERSALPVAADVEITGELLAALAGWWARFGVAWLALAARELLTVAGAALVEVARLLFVRVPVWAWRLPRENQAVLAVALVAVGLGVHVATLIAAETRPMVEVFGPPLWMLGIGVALFIARCAERPIVLLVPFGLVLWVLFPPRVVVALVGLTVIAVYWTSRKGNVTSHRAMTGGTIATAHFAPHPGHAACPRETAEHEGGHAAAAVAAGGRVIRARAYANGAGWCRSHIPDDKDKFKNAVKFGAVYVAGEVAQGNRNGCDSDQASFRRIINRLPSHQRPMARTASYASARSAQYTHAHIRRAVASALIRTGHYR